MKTIDISPEEMNARVARYADLVPYGRQHTESIAPEVFEQLTARRVLSIMAPHNYTGRSAQAPIKSVPGAVISIAETPPGNAPALHCHDTAIENFFVINGRYRIIWGDEGQHSLELGPMDFISIPPHVNRTFLNITDETARLLAIIQPLNEAQEDRVAFATSVASHIAEQFGGKTVDALKKIGFDFDFGPGFRSLMDFRLSADQRELQDAARRFAAAELPPLARRLEDTAEPVPHDWLKRYAALGFLGINTPVAFGGLGLPLIDALIVLEEFAKISVAVAFPVFECCTGPLRIVERLGDPALSQRIVPRAVAGELLVAVSMSEPDAGTALTDLKTRARIDGDEIIIDGVKRWCSGAGHSGGYVVFCRFDGVPGAKGIGAVFVDLATPGLSFGEQEHMMGFRGVPSADIFLDNVRVPKTHLLAGPGEFAALMGMFNIERLGNATMALGVAAGALEQAAAYVQERRQFGKPIIDFQAVQLRLGSMVMQVEASRLLIHRAAANAVDGLPDAQEAAIAKCFANEMTRTVCADAMQLMGGYGYARAYGVEQKLRDSFGWGIAGGAIDIQKVNIAGGLVGRRFNQR